MPDAYVHDLACPILHLIPDLPRSCILFWIIYTHIFHLFVIYIQIPFSWAWFQARDLEANHFYRSFLDESNDIHSVDCCPLFSPDFISICVLNRFIIKTTGLQQQWLTCKSMRGWWILFLPVDLTLCLWYMTVDLLELLMIGMPSFTHWHFFSPISTRVSFSYRIFLLGFMAGGYLRVPRTGGLFSLINLRNRNVSFTWSWA